MDELEELKAQILARKIKQNERRIKKGLKPKHKIPKKKVAKKLPKKKWPWSPPPPDSGELEDTAMSFQEWKDAGFWIKKGSKSTLTDALGEPQFTADQVRKSNPSWAKYRKRA